MINKLSVKNFKSLKIVENIPLGNINLFTGMNGVGKSSLIQVLLLLRQSFLKNKHEDYLLLNDELVELGTAVDVVSEFRDSNNIIFSFGINEDIHTIGYQYNQDEVNEAKLDLHIKPRDTFWKIGLFSDDFEYISTERIGPRVFYRNQRDLDNNRLGNQGEFAVERLYKLIEQDYKIELEGLAHPDTYDDDFDFSIKAQVNAWLSEISPNVLIHTEVDGKKGIHSSSFAFKHPTKISTNRYSSINVGFGLTYVLPVILAILTAKKGSIIIIENPESHLHPKGQSKLAELMAIAADNGVQLFVETHSDHIFYGLRVAIKDELLEANKAKVLFFQRNSNDMTTNIEVINIDKNGKIDNEPKGFFDEYVINLKSLI